MTKTTLSFPFSEGTIQMPGAFLSLLVLVILSSFAAAQEPDEIAPPPLKLMSKTERNQLSAATDIKDRTQLALRMMDSRISSAEKYNKDENYSLMFAELGGFHALMDNTLRFLLRSGPHQGKVLNNLKRFEITLRSFAPRLEVVRRESPNSFEPYVRNLIRYVSETRERAMESFYSNTAAPNISN